MATTHSAHDVSVLMSGDVILGPGQPALDRVHESVVKHRLCGQAQPVGSSSGVPVR